MVPCWPTDQHGTGRDYDHRDSSHYSSCGDRSNSRDADSDDLASSHRLPCPFECSGSRLTQGSSSSGNHRERLATTRMASSLVLTRPGSLIQLNRTIAPGIPRWRSADDRSPIRLVTHLADYPQCTKRHNQSDRPEQSAHRLVSSFFLGWQTRVVTICTVSIGQMHNQD